MQKNNVRNNIGTSIGAERIVWQTDSPQQISSLCNVLAGRRILAVHRKAAGDEGHDAARTHLVDGLGKEIVVDRKSQLVVCLIVDLVLTERHIAHGKIIEITAVSGFKASHLDVGFRVELFRNAACDAVQFHTVHAAVLHGVRQHPEEVAHAHARLQNVATTETHALHCIVDGMDHGGAGVVGVQDRATGSGIFFLGEQPFQFRVLVCPIALVRVKSVWQTAPADILRKHFLFLGGGSTVLLFQLKQGADSCNVPGVLLLCAALTQMLVRNAEISGSFRHRVSVQGFVCGSCIRECLPFAVDLYRNRQLVQ